MNQIFKKYFDKLMKAPRVTEILRYFSGFQYVPKNILEKAAARGSSVHAICAGIAKGAWVPDGMVPQELKGYVDSFRKWADEEVAEFMIIEKRYQDEERNFSGQLGFVVKSKAGQDWLVDLKTSAAPQKTYPVQMAAYQYLLKNHGVYVKGAQLVYLDREGDTPKVHRLEDMSEETRIFLCALDCWHFFNKGKRNVRRNTRKS